MNKSPELTLLLYCIKVRERQPSYRRFWNKLKEAEKEAVQRIVSNVEEIETASIREFLDSQFDNFPEEFCQKTFNRPYPPLNILGSVNAISRYYKWKRTKRAEKKKLEPLEKIITAIKNGDAIYNNLDEADHELIVLALFNESINYRWLAWRLITDEDGWDECLNVLSKMDWFLMNKVKSFVSSLENDQKLQEKIKEELNG